MTESLPWNRNPHQIYLSSFEDEGSSHIAILKKQKAPAVNLNIDPGAFLFHISSKISIRIKNQLNKGFQ